MSKSKKHKHRKKQPERIPAKDSRPDAAPWLERNGNYVLLAAWGIFLALYLSLATDELGGVLGGDNARYLMLARSLAEHASYRDWYLPGAPAHTQYPFLFPLLISAFASSPNQVFYSHLMIQLVASLVPLLLCGFARLEEESKAKSLVIFFLAASIPAWYSFLLNILTEPVFMLFMMLAIFILSYGKRRGFNIFTAILFSLAVLASALIREVGLVLFGALFIGIILERGLRKVRVARVPLWVFFAATFIAGWSAWNARNMLTGEGGFYFKQFLEKNPYQPQLGMMGFGDAVERILSNLNLHLPHVGGFAFPNWIFNSPRAAMIVALIFLLIMAFGLISRMRAGQFAVEIVFLSLFGIALVWFFKEERFSLPVLPLAVFYFLKGMDSLMKFLGAKTQAVTIALAAALAVWQVCFTGWLCIKYHQPQIFPQGQVMVDGYGPWSKPVIDASKYFNYWLYPREFWQGTANFIIIQEVAKELLPQDAVIACRKPTLAWYFADRKATWYKYGVSPGEEWEDFRKNKITHVIISSSNAELVQMVNANPDSFDFLAVIQKGGIGLAKLKYPQP